MFTRQHFKQFFNDVQRHFCWAFVAYAPFVATREADPLDLRKDRRASSLSSQRGVSDFLLSSARGRDLPLSEALDSLELYLDE